MRNSSHIVLLSGGQDSTTVLWDAAQDAMNTQRDEGLRARIHCLTFDYGQRHAVELESARRVFGLVQAAHPGLTMTHEVVKIPPQLLGGSSPLTDHSRPVKEYSGPGALPGGLEDTFIPGRNILFLSIAGSRAKVLGAMNIWIGISQEDSGGYPDCRLDFTLAMERALWRGLDSTVIIHTPLIGRTKGQALEFLRYLEARYRDECQGLGAEVGPLASMAYTHTCYQGSVPPCGRCHACILRARGFQEAGMDDPLLTHHTTQDPTP